MIHEKTLGAIRRHAMFEPGDRVLVAVSGGPDSVALLHVLLDLHEELPLVLGVAHLDHALRGADAEADLRFVEALARGLGLPFTAGREDVRALARGEKRSLEEAGRRARRRFLRQAARETRARRVALGHHRDDQAESVLMRLVSGAGRGGLAGIRPVSERLFVRPLIDCAREEILEYLRARKIEFRTDASNEDLSFPRNRIRHRVLPLLKEGLNPRVAEAIARTADLLREEDDYLEGRARRALRRVLISDPIPASVLRAAESPAPVHGPIGSVGSARAGTSKVPATSAGAPRAPRSAANPAVALDAGRLARLPSPIARRVVRLALRRAGLRGRDLPRRRIEEVLALVRGGEHASRDLGEGIEARYEYGHLLLETGSTRAAPVWEGALLAVPGEIAIPSLAWTLSARLAPIDEVRAEMGSATATRAHLDADRIAPPLLVRSPRPGDRFRPLGAPGARKLSDLWTDLKVPRKDRARILVLESEGRIVWASGLRIADDARVTPGTTSVAVIDLAPLEGTPGRLAVLYTAREIREAVERLALEIARWAAGHEIVLLGILQGSFVFLADLARRLPGPVRIGFVDRMGSPLAGAERVRGERVVLVEDILDTGESLSRVLERVRAEGPREVRTCVLFDKPSRRAVPIEADWIGLPVPDRWVVGYGLDLEGRWRNLPYLTYRD